VRKRVLETVTGWLVIATSGQWLLVPSSRYSPALGVLAGKVTRSRWAMLVPPLILAVGFELRWGRAGRSNRRGIAVRYDRSHPPGLRSMRMRAHVRPTGASARLRTR
jgi:hypothetical protein